MSELFYKIKARYTSSSSIDRKVSWLCGADACFFKIKDKSILVDTEEVWKKLRDIGITKEDNTKLYFRFDKKGKFYVKRADVEGVFLNGLSVKYEKVKRFYEVAERLASSKKEKGLDLLREELKGHKHVREEEEGFFWIKISSGSSVDPLQQVAARIKAVHKKRWGGSGESEAHKALKMFVEGHPDKLDVSDAASAETEFPLPSGDRVDVAFDDEKRFVLAEVKSAISDESDVERGLYQCVKYEAVAKKWLEAEEISRSVRAVLVLESALPEKLQRLKDMLGIEVYENIKPGG